MKKASYYFTFGSNHVASNGMSLGNRFCVIIAENENEARSLMEEARGPKYCTSYSEADGARGAGVERFGLREVSLNDIYLEK